MASLKISLYYVTAFFQAVRRNRQRYLSKKWRFAKDSLNLHPFALKKAVNQHFD